MGPGEELRDAYRRVLLDRAESTPSPARVRWRLVGRDEQLAAIARAATADPTEGRLVVVDGEAGIGRSPRCWAPCGTRRRGRSCGAPGTRARPRWRRGSRPSESHRRGRRERPCHGCAAGGPSSPPRARAGAPRRRPPRRLGLVGRPHRPGPAGPAAGRRRSGGGTRARRRRTGRLERVPGRPRPARRGRVPRAGGTLAGGGRRARPGPVLRPFRRGRGPAGGARQPARVATRCTSRPFSTSWSPSPTRPRATAVVGKVPSRLRALVEGPEPAARRLDLAGEALDLARRTGDPTIVLDAPN